MIKLRWGTISFLVLLLFFFTPLHTHAQHKKEVRTGGTKILYGTSSFYSNKFNGRKTANGEIFSQSKLTCACNALPLGTWIKVTNLRNGKSVIVKVNDRIHPKMRRIVDLSRAAAGKLGFLSSGLTRVKVQVFGKARPQ